LFGVASIVFQLLWGWARLKFGIVHISSGLLFPWCHVSQQKKPPHSGLQIFVSHLSKTEGVKLAEAVGRWKAMQPAEQDEWNQKCAAAKQAFKSAAAKEAL
jgi:hypothetical protein